MRFDLTDLALFLHVVQAGSITHGAARANLALAAASARIRNLEASLGAPLLERGRHGVTPTPAGQKLASHARLMLAQAERLRDDLSGYAGEFGGSVRVLSNTNALTAFLPEALSGFLAAHPRINVELQEMLSDEIVEAIADGSADIGIVAGTVDTGALETHPYRCDRFVLIVPRGHALAGRAQSPSARCWTRISSAWTAAARCSASWRARPWWPASPSGCACSCAASTPCAGWCRPAWAWASFLKARRTA